MQVGGLSRQQRGHVAARGDRFHGRSFLARARGKHLLFVGAWVPDDFRTEFAAWYEIDHAPLLMDCPVWDGCRVVEQEVDKGAQFFAIHQLADLSALESEERKAARATPWFERLKVHDWFDEAFSRRVMLRRKI